MTSEPLPETIEDPRTRLAAERTLLAWIRTGLALMGFGFVVARFGLFLRELAEMGRFPMTHSRGLSIWIGIILVAMGIIVNLVAAREHAVLLKALQIPHRRASYYLGSAVAVVLAILGVGIIVYLLLIRA